MKKNTINYLYKNIVEIITAKKRGALLDLGCGNGNISRKLQENGFFVIAADLDITRFHYSDSVPFSALHLDDPLPFADNSFEYVLFLEVIEHIYNPAMVIEEIQRILVPGGTLIISTPNILSAHSRLRFLFEGSFDFFREPPLEYSRVFPKASQNMHVIPWRYQELEYLLITHNFTIKNISTDLIKTSHLIPAFLLKPALVIQALLKKNRSRKKRGVDYRRINRILLSKKMLGGRHLILEAEKQLSV